MAVVGFGRRERATHAGARWPMVAAVSFRGARTGHPRRHQAASRGSSWCRGDERASRRVDVRGASGLVMPVPGGQPWAPAPRANGPPTPTPPGQPWEQLVSGGRTGHPRRHQAANRGGGRLQRGANGPPTLAPGGQPWEQLVSGGTTGPPTPTPPGQPCRPSASRTRAAHSRRHQAASRGGGWFPGRGRASHADATRPVVDRLPARERAAHADATRPVPRTCGREGAGGCGGGRARGSRRSTPRRGHWRGCERAELTGVNGPFTPGMASMTHPHAHERTTRDRDSHTPGTNPTRLHNPTATNKHPSAPAAHQTSQPTRSAVHQASQPTSTPATHQHPRNPPSLKTHQAPKATKAPRHQGVSDK